MERKEESEKGEKAPEDVGEDRIRLNVGRLPWIQSSIIIGKMEERNSTDTKRGKFAFVTIVSIVAEAGNN